MIGGNSYARRWRWWRSTIPTSPRSTDLKKKDGVRALVMAVPVRSAAPLEFGVPAPLFQFFTPQRGFPQQKPPYDVTPDGQRFIVSAVVRRTEPSLYVLLNWPALAGR